MSGSGGTAAAVTPWSQPLSHVGYVVPDLEEGLEHLTAQFGLRWASIQDRAVVLRTADGGTQEARFRFTWSLQGPVHLEVFQEAPATVWTRSGAGPFHHLSYWVPDLLKETNRLRANGYRLEVTRDGADEINGFGYFIGPDGLRVEPKPEATRPALQTWLGGGELT